VPSRRGGGWNIGQPRVFPNWNKTNQAMMKALEDQSLYWDRTRSGELFFYRE
jgi:hypothetical protein